MFERFLGHIDDPAPRRFLTAQAPSDRERFAGDYAGNGIADLLTVGVHHPRHDLRIGSYVRGRYILVRTDQGENLCGVSSCQPL